jgi:cytochrome c-type biogenesis protein CcsB
LIVVAYALLWVALAAYLVYSAGGRRGVGWAATGVVMAAWILWLGGLIERGYTGGHWPLSNRYEFALCFAWAALSLYLLLEASWHERRAGAVVLLVVVFVATYAITRPETMQAVVPLLPALRSPWLQLHVLAAAVGYGAAGVGAGLGLARLLSGRLSERLPPVDEIEQAMSRSVALGFPWLTFSVLAGAVWAQTAWGRLWGWDPKETWALVAWLWYLMLLHLRPLPRWRGRRMAVLLLVGFAVMMFTFIGVPWLVRLVRLESLHGF